jgi:branched-chain amino acid transport system permease protein
MSFFDILNFDFLSLHLAFIGIFIMLALSLNLINGFSGMFSLGHQGFWAVGAYAAGVFILYCNFLPGPLMFILSLIVGASVAGLFGLGVGLPCLRLAGDYLAIATLGFGEIVRIIFQNLQTDKIHGPLGFEIPALLVPRTAETIVARSLIYLALIWTFVILTILIIRNIVKSSHGRAILALRDDEVAAELVGIDTTRYKVLVFVIGAGLAGLAGALFVNFKTDTNPEDFLLMKGIVILLYVVLGGMGSISGTIMAVIVLYSAEQSLKLQLFGWLGEDIGRLAAKWWQVIFPLILIILMLSRPQGIMGKKEITQLPLFRKLTALLRSKQTAPEAKQ